jgi:ABC-2 type transport system permease protein
VSALIPSHRWANEWRLLRRSPGALAIAMILLALTTLGLALGHIEITRQQRVIAEAQQLQQADIAAIADWVSVERDGGSAAYYSFHLTWDEPAPLAFTALGLRDAAPWLLRVRALGLEAQLYENDSGNAELMKLGRLDFAFVLIWLVPLLVIALFHDVISGEREAGRLTLLQTTAANRVALWLPRLALRTLLALLALVLPLAAAGLWMQVPMSALGELLAISALYLLFWVALATFVSSRRGSTATHASALAALWFCLTLVFPALGQLAIAQRHPAPQGMELTLAQRDKVHAAWDIPRDDTMQAFFRTHPQWRNTAPVTTPFHWKWYLAFHQVGDESVADQVAAYRAALERRQRATHRLGWLLPPLAAQNRIHALTRTDLPAHLRYLDQVRAFHGELRQFYYPYLFNEAPFGKADFERAPRFQPLR